HDKGGRRKHARDPTNWRDTTLANLALENRDDFGVGGIRDYRLDAGFAGGGHQQARSTHRDSQPADDPRPSKFGERKPPATQEVDGAEDIALLEVSHREWCSRRLAHPSHVEAQHTEAVASERSGQFQQMGAWIFAVGSRAVNDHDRSIDRQPAVREHAGNQPAFQADLIVTARKADIGEAKAQAGWSLDDRLRGLVDEFFGDVARDPYVP